MPLAVTNEMLQANTHSNVKISIFSREVDIAIPLLQNYCEASQVPSMYEIIFNDNAEEDNAGHGTMRDTHYYSNQDTAAVS